METPKLLTDDMDIRDTELSMYHGNNGDYYICLKETKRGNVVKLDTRISMSGGNATPEIRQAVSSLFKALLWQNDDTGESGLHLQSVSNHVKNTVVCCSNCEKCTIYEDENCKPSDRFYCKDTEDFINDIEQHYCDNFVRE